MLRASGPPTPATGEHEIEGLALPYQPGQANGPAVHERHPEAPAVHAEHGVGGRDPQIAPQGELETARHRVALYGGDHRLGQLEAGGAHGPGPVLENRPGVPFGQCLQVGSCTEVASLAGQDGHRGTRVGLERLEGPEQLAGGERVDGVAPLGPADAHHADRPVPCDLDVPRHLPVIFPDEPRRGETPGRIKCDLSRHQLPGAPLHSFGASQQVYLPALMAPAGNEEDPCPYALAT